MDAYFLFYVLAKVDGFESQPLLENELIRTEAMRRHTRYCFYGSYERHIHPTVAVSADWQHYMGFNADLRRVCETCHYGYGRIYPLMQLPAPPQPQCDSCENELYPMTTISAAPDSVSYDDRLQKFINYLPVALHRLDSMNNQVNTDALQAALNNINAQAINASRHAWAARPGGRPAVIDLINQRNEADLVLPNLVRHFNYDGRLPGKSARRPDRTPTPLENGSRSWWEEDLAYNNVANSRGAARYLFSLCKYDGAQWVYDPLIFVTYDHYNTFIAVPF